MDFIFGIFAGVALTVGFGLLAYAIEKLRSSRAPRRSRVRSTYVTPRHAKATRSKGRHKKS